MSKPDKFTIKIDLHLHTCVSEDGALHPADVVKIARRKGLDRICITDHNSLDGARVAQKIDPDLVIVGEEIMTNVGSEILAFFVRKWIPPLLSPEETLARLADQGAVINVSHPFDRHRHPWPERLLTTLIPHLDAIETFNARTIRAQDNKKARTFALTHNLPMTAGSDAHTAMEIGAAYVEIPPFDTADEFRAGLVHATIHGSLSPAWIHLFSTLNKLRGKLGLKPIINS
ncbi:MAG: PHP domain-containing protein [Anaerolineae bacterium]|nr:PHP domain-containing protein [Anaerolineae bacterium]